MLKRFLSYYKSHKALISIDMACAFFLAVFAQFFPMITRQIINDYVPNRNLRMILIWCVLLLAIYLVKGALSYTMSYLGHILGIRLQRDMRRDIFSHLQKLPFSYFDNHKTGAIMSRVINDLQEISELAHHGPEDLIVSFITIIGAFLMLAGVNIWLTLIIFAFFPIFIWIVVKKRAQMNEAFTKSRQRISEINAGVENSISGIRVSKSFVNGEYENKKFSGLNNMFYEARAKVYRTMAEFNFGIDLVTDLFSLITMFSGGLFCYYGKISYGDFAAYLIYVGMFTNPIKKLASFIEQYQDGISGFRRFIELMDTEGEIDSPNAAIMPSVTGKIEFCDVSFKYDDSQQILQHININISAGKKVALVGPSGGGKTTLCHLIPRFYELQDGKILIDGTDITSVTRASLRNNIGLVSQDVFLFTGTIRDNIAYPEPDADEDKIIEAAKLAKIHDFIIEQPDGYDTFVGERGIKLSGGQKQRIAIARIFLKNPPILILDEATSALDNQTEQSVQNSLDELCIGRTTLVVAHRLSTVKNADMILVMTKNGIEEQGTHDELLANGTIYKDLYNAQFRTHNT